MRKYPYTIFKWVGLRWSQDKNQGFPFKIILPWLASYKRNDPRDYEILFDRQYYKDGLTHESIHSIQMWEFGPFFFMWYIIYYINFGINWITNGFNAFKAYRDVAYEIEAYENQGKEIEVYASTRKPFGWISYLFSKEHKYKGERRRLWER